LEESKRQLEDMKRQLSEKTKECENAQEEVEAMRTAEQGQRIALLDELNSVQTENGQLRAQLRAAKAGR
jgi:polyhydroxyalkanoate synthesis regulator phasin